MKLGRIMMNRQTELQDRRDYETYAFKALEIYHERAMEISQSLKIRE